MTNSVFSLCTVVVLCLGAVSVNSLPESCSSQVYCYGDLLRTIQVDGNLYDDSKTFVDKKMKYDENTVLDNFEKLKAEYGGTIPRKKLIEYMNENFEDGKELEVATPADWTATPSILARIKDPDLRQWASDLNVLNKNLTRRVKDDVKQSPDRYSLLYVPNNFVIPGGRFTELYYWDTYWIVRGLLLCDQADTVKGIIGNFVYMLETYGIIPNGGRVYYLQRSQPPLLTPMVANYYLATKDLIYVKTIMDSLDKEFQFWMDNRTVEVSKNGKTYQMARYYAPSEGPRPESYREDYEIAHKTFSSEERQREYYIDMKSAAESGWDFSSRWFIKDGSNNGNLSHIHTKYIIPVDINSFVCWNARLLSEFHKKLGDISKAAKYAKIAADFKEAIQEVMWNDEKGVWFDYDLLNNKQREYFYPSNVAPLWTKCYDQSQAPVIAQKVVDYLEKTDIKSYLGGIPTSENKTGEQWDLPNAWPPLQGIVIQGLDETQQPAAKNMALEFAKHWISANYKGYQQSQEMYEKYDAENPGQYGGGGEYTVQSGFGWTNGVILELLATYGERLSANGNNNSVNKPRKRWLWDILRPHGGK